MVTRLILSFSIYEEFYVSPEILKDPTLFGHFLPLYGFGYVFVPRFDYIARFILICAIESEMRFQSIPFNWHQCTLLVVFWIVCMIFVVICLSPYAFPVKVRFPACIKFFYYFFFYSCQHHRPSLSGLWSGTNLHLHLV